MTRDYERFGPLGGPLAGLAVAVGLALVAEGCGRFLHLGLALAVTAVSVTLLGASARKVGWFVLLVMSSVFLLGAPAHYPVAHRFALAIVFAGLLWPLMLSSRRARKARPDTDLDRALRRTPWVVAAATTPPLCRLVGRVCTNPLYVGTYDRTFHRLPLLLHSLAWAPVALALVCVALDVGTLLRVARAAQRVRARPDLLRDQLVDFGVGDEAHSVETAPAASYRQPARIIVVRGSSRDAFKALGRLLVIDACAVMVAAGFLTTVPHRSSHVRRACQEASV